MFDQILKNAHEKFYLYYNVDTSIDFFILHWVDFDINLVLPVLSKSTLLVLVRSKLSIAYEFFLSIRVDFASSHEMFPRHVSNFRVKLPESKLD